MSTRVGIRRFAVALPGVVAPARLYREQFGRCAASIEAKRVPDHDEDAFTLALQAARATPAGAAMQPRAVLTASAGTPPDAGLLADTLDVAGARVASFQGLTAGVDALLAARDLAQATGGDVLVVSSDTPTAAPDDDAEHGLGAAATAWLVGASAPLAFAGEGHAQVPALGAENRSADAAAQAWKALGAAGVALDGVAHLALSDLDRGLVKGAQKVLPKARLAQPGRLVGAAGATTPLLGLATALQQAEPGQVVGLLATDHGRAVALALEPTTEVPRSGRSLDDALAEPAEELGSYGDLARRRGWLVTPGSGVSQGAAISAADHLASLPARLRWEGQRCRTCSKALFPPRAACQHCGSADLAPLRLSGKGEVYSLVTIGRGSAPAEFAEQQRRAGAYDVAVVQLAEGPRVAAMVAGPSGALAMGDAVELVVRRLYTQDGAARYGFKAFKAA